MLGADVPGEDRQAIEIAKRYAWAQPGAGEEYQYFAYRSTPVLRVKNLVEIGLVMEHARGPRILDAGAGTGRFTLPLRQRGYKVVALDVSREMIDAGRRAASKRDIPFPAIMGLVERLPFPDACFDSVVSITVVRHFPDWPRILDEYARVTKPGGRIIFDMASGDQAAFMARLGHGAASRCASNPLEFDATMTLGQLGEISRERGWSIMFAGPHDFFNANRLLEHVLADSKPAFEARLHEFLGHTDCVALCDLLSRRFLTALSPAACTSWMAVLEKTPAGPWRPAFTRASLPADGTPLKRLGALLAACIPDTFEAYLREIPQLMAAPVVRTLADWLEQELLPRFPLDALTWTASRDTMEDIKR
jgi:SAM-dependent methyltransferase